MSPASSTLRALRTTRSTKVGQNLDSKCKRRDLPAKIEDLSGFKGPQNENENFVQDATQIHS